MFTICYSKPLTPTLYYQPSPQPQPFLAHCKKLDLTAARLHLSDFDALAKCASIRTLVLKLYDIDFDASMTVLGKGCPNLTELDIHLPFRESLTAAGLKALAKAPFQDNLKSLRFRGAGIEADACVYLSQFPRLQKLSLLLISMLLGIQTQVWPPGQLRKCLSPSLKWLSLVELNDDDLVIIGEVSLQCALLLHPIALSNTPFLILGLPHVGACVVAQETWARC